MSDLHRKVALIIGARNGMIEGVARGLGEAAATVYVDRGDEPVDALVRRIMAEQGHLDILVNCVCGEYEDMVDNGAFAECYAASRQVAETMATQRSGVIVHVPFWAGQQHGQQVTDDTARANAQATTNTAQWPKLILYLLQSLEKHTTPYDNFEERLVTICEQITRRMNKGHR